MMQHRRRQATAEELAQGQREMKAAEARMKKEGKKRGELPLEDGVAEGSQGGKGPPGGDATSTDLVSTRSPTLTVPSTEDSHSKVSAATSSTPRPKTEAPSPGKPKKEEEAHMRTPQVLGPKAIQDQQGEDGKGSVKGGGVGGIPEESEVPEQHSICTPPLFTPAQLDDLHRVQQQAPWLYAKVGTPMYDTPMHSILDRPAFLEQEVWKGKGGRRDDEEKENLMLRVHERMEFERQEKEEMMIQMQQLLSENNALRAEMQAKPKGPMGGPTMADRRISHLLEENQRLHQEVRRLSWVQPTSKEDDPVFATPNGSSGCDEHAGGRGRTKTGVEEVPEDRPREGDGKGKEAGREATGKGRGTKKKEGSLEDDSVHQQTPNVILKVVEGMQKIQDRMSQGGSTGQDQDPETVRHSVDLPKLAEWNGESAPIDFSDWLLLLAPLMADLTPSSEEWWTLTLEEARQWYQKHLVKSPLDRLTHQIVPSTKLSMRKWSRLEKRATALLLSAVPEALREEVVSSKSLTAFGILVKGMIAYQPGGLAERQAILAALESPAEASTVGQGIVTLRRWLRWKRRAEEVGVSIPDPTILARGLGRLMKKLITMFPELNFRLQLVRSSLMVDAVPTHESVSKYSEHLLAELEQMGHQARKKDSSGEAPKKFEEQPKDSREGRTRKEGEEKEKPKCRFYLSDQGCRRGKSCTFSHEQKDEKKRCWICGSPEHFAPACTRPKEAKEGSPRPKISKAEKEKVGKNKSEDEEGEEVQPSIKELLKEANDMLKGMNGGPSPSSSNTSPSSKGGDTSERSEVVERLQQQLNALKQKTFKLRRLKKGERQGLLDSGATHPLRPVKKGEDVESYKRVQVALADGQVTSLPISPGGAMVSADADIEPIIPMGLLTEKLGCSVIWSRSQLRVVHPLRGELPVEDQDGCPQLPRQVALDLIEELEKVKKGMKLKEENDFEWEIKWMEDYVNAHPVLSRLPKEVKESLVVKPGEWSDLPANRRKRKAMKRDGYVCHLYAGADEGFTFERAWKQKGGEERELLEVDIKRGPGHDMLLDRGPYAGLVRSVWEGKLLALLGGPNCRTRSVMRHKQVDWTTARPIRKWGGEEFGVKDASSDERRKLFEDDVLLWRMIFLAMLDSSLKKAREETEVMGFGIEQPASPKDYNPEVVSFWDTTEWKDLQKEFGWKEVTFFQKPLGGAAKKPTTVAGTLELIPEEFSTKTVSHALVRGSWELARWPPGMMTMLAEAVMTQVMKKKAKACVLSWSEHIALGHTPSRRDCRICQEARQQCSPHRQVQHKLAGVLSLDTAGPLKPAYDLGGFQSRYFLAGTLTWAVPCTVDIKGQGEEQLSEEGQEEWPPIEEDSKDDEEGEDKAEVEEGDEVLHGLTDAEEEAGEDLLEQIHRDEEERDDELGKAEEKPPKDFKIETFRLALPMHSKKAKEVTRTTMDMLLRLRMDGYSVAQIHTDQGHEYAGHFHGWTRRRGIILTKTAGDEPQSNGRAEAAVKALKSMVRKALHQAKETSKWWPWALRHCNKVLRAKRLHQVPNFPPFLTEVMVRRRRWKRDDLGPTSERVRYLCPSPENHGHWIVRDDERPRLTRCYMRRLEDPPTEGHWIALEKELLDGLSLRRRIRGKTAVKKIQKEQGEVEEKEEEAKRRMRKVLEEEALLSMEDSPQLAVINAQLIARLRRSMVAAEVEEEEVLQTRIVSAKEVAQNWEAWKPAAGEEVISLVEEKLALQPIPKKEMKELIEDAEKRGIRIELIPSKLVFTRKPGKKGGKKKVRWVVCGNFESKDPNEDNFSGGADSAALRIMIWVASVHQWEGSVLDVKTAFLNAEMEQKEDQQLLLVCPPSFFVDRGFLDKDTYYLPKKAVYGFRRSPRLWGEHRDKTLQSLEIDIPDEAGRVSQVQLTAMESEPNLWRIVQKDEDDEEGSQLQGLLMTYVDDIFITAPSRILQAVEEKIRSTWTTSTPERISEKPTKFLGIEIMKQVNQETQRDRWLVTQQSFITDLLEQESEVPKPRKIPITKDQSVMEEDDPPPTAAEVKGAQKVVGE